MGCSEASRNWICTCSAYVHTLHIETNCSTATISWRLSAIHRCHVCTRLYVDRGHGYGNSETGCKSIVLFNWRRHAEPKWNLISLKTDTPFWKQTHDSQWISMSKRCSTVQWLKAGDMSNHLWNPMSQFGTTWPYQHTAVEGIFSIAGNSGKIFCPDRCNMKDSAFEKPMFLTVMLLATNIGK